MILDWKLNETPVAVVDVETTGLNPGADRIVEVAVVHLPPAGPPELVYETLVNPMQPVTAAAKHQIRLADIERAPRFEMIAANLAEHLTGAVIAGHNAFFDVRFLATELGQLGVPFNVPFVCTMDLRPMLDLGHRCSLEEACAAYHLAPGELHTAACDALATAYLLEIYRREMLNRGLQTFRQLTALGNQKFFRSWDRQPLGAAAYRHLRGETIRKANTATAGPIPASAEAAQAVQVAQAFPQYAFALLEAVSDYYLSEDEMAQLEEIRNASELSDGQVRAIHASVYTWALSQFSADGEVDEAERQQLSALHDCLSRLGWAPGQ